MADFTLGLLDAPADPSALFALQPSVATGPAGDRSAGWRGAVYDMDGVYYGELPSLRMKNFRWKEQPPWQADVEISLDDPGLAFLKRSLSPPREIVLERQGRIFMMGPFVSRRANHASRTYTGTVYDAMWYLANGRRNIGNPNRTNYLINPSAETGDTTGWAPAGGVIFAASTTRHKLGTHAFHLIGDGSNMFAHQDIGFTSGPHGTTLYLTAWMFTDVFTGPAPFGASLRLERIGGTGPFAVGQTFDSVAALTPHNSWIRQSCFVKMPPLTTETIRAFLYAPNGEKFYDAISLVTDEGLHFISDFDQGTTLRYLMGYFQGTGPLAARAPEKSDLRIRLDIDEATGVVRNRVYHFADHARAYNAGDGLAVIDDLVIAPPDGMDLRMTYARAAGGGDPITRTLVARTDLSKTITDFVFTYEKYPDAPERDASEGVVGYDYGNTIDGSATDPCELGGWGGSSDNVTREEGGASDRTLLGGLSIELVETAPDTAPIDELADIAAGRVAQLGHALETLTLKIREPRHPVTDLVTYPLVGVLEVGDHIFVKLRDGDLVWHDAVAPDQPIECVIVDLQLAEDETLSAAVNRFVSE